MAKQAINVNFSGGLDRKTDPIQVPFGKFLLLQNTVFNIGGLLQKRNGYANLPALPDATSNFVTTFNGALTAIGTKLEAFSEASNTWTNKGNILPVQLGVLPMIRNNTNQTQVDSAVSPSGLVCVVYTDQNPASLGATIFRYAVLDQITGQNIIPPTTLNADAIYGTPRVFVSGSYFIILYTTPATYHLDYVAINTVSLIVGSPVSITASITPSTTLSFDAAVLGTSLYIAWDLAGGGGVQMVQLTQNLVLTSSVHRDAVNVATMMSVTTDPINNIVWVTYYDSGSTNGWTFAVDQNMNSVLAVTQVITSKAVLNLTASAYGGTSTIFYEVSNNYSYDSSIPTHFINTLTQTQTGTTGSTTTLIRSIGLASKSFMIGSAIYFMAEYLSAYQPTYFLMNVIGQVIAELAYSNGGGNAVTATTTGYLPFGLPQVSVSGNVVQIPYLFKDLIAAVNKNTAVPSGNQVAGIYSQTGINLASFTIGSSVISAETGKNLQLTGGFLWNYDGYIPVENNFFVWPDSVELSPSTTGGSLTAQTYYYQVTYEWTDNQGNAYRSAPSIPVSTTTTGSTSSIVIKVPTLRLTYKIANPVKIVIYRFSTDQETYYQVTSLTAPILNSTTSDSISYPDTLADSSILGNNILYTNGGVVEDIGPPSFSSVFIFDDRLWGVDSEDPNLLWFSKQVIEGTPVEMSDLLTFYVAPNIGAQGASGPLRYGAPMDDKAVLFKDAAIEYFNGTGPDNTGANSQFSQPILITSTVGSTNQKSVVFMPNGLMFEFKSESGNQIWLLGRDLSTSYIGADVQGLTQNATVQSAVNIPGANEVRFTMSSGITLVYNYYYSKWGTFVGVPAISSTLYQGLHTYINQYGQVLQESPGIYLDGTNPVLIAFTTGWIGLSGIRGYQRIYEFSFIGTYFSPHKLAIQVAYDYNPPSHQALYTPSNFSPVYGADPIYGGLTPYGGPSNIENFRIHAQRQLCKSFQISVQEVFDPSFGVQAGAGVSLSGINMVMDLKKGWAPTPGSQSVG